MPRRDGSGPSAMGPMTGRGAGNCAQHVRQGYTVPTHGCGMGRGFGRRAPRGNRAPMCDYIPAQAPISVQEDRAAINQEVELLEGRLNELKNRINSLQQQD